jgi:hypothetical protein
MLKRALTTFLFLVVALFSDNAAYALTIPASEDSIGYNNQITASGNSAVQLAVDVNRKAFIYFNLNDIPTNAVVRWAKLRMFLPTVTAKGSGLSIYQVGGVWNECKSSPMPYIQPYAVASIPADQLGNKRFVTADVTATVQNWISMRALNEGFAIAPTLGYYGTSTLTLTSKEGPNLGIPAELDIEFQPETKPLTVDQLPASLTSLLTPKIVSQPVLGYSGLITAGVQGIGNLTYQWYKGGIPVAGGTSASLSLDGLSSGTYTLKTSNGFASAMSSGIAFNSNNYIPNFSLIPAGTFQMGDNLDGNPDAPVHNVYVSQFFMAQTELTYGEWLRVKTWADSHGYQFDNAGAGNGDNYPVTTVNWYDAIKWCNAKSEMEGLAPCYYTEASQVSSTTYRNGRFDLNNEMVDWKANGYRLATEAEWEKAGRALFGKRYPNGDILRSSDTNFGSIIGGTTPVKNYAPNGYELHDMAGNVWQWCWDRYGSISVSDTSDPHGALTSLDRILRGGAWNSESIDCRVSRRYSIGQEGLYDTVGFRLVRTSKVLNPRDITSGLVAYYPFNGSANDASGNSYNLTSVETTLTSDRFGSTNSACNFNGTSSYLSVSGIPIPTNNCFTWALWVKTDNGAVDRPLMERAYSIGSGELSPSLWTQSSNGDINSLRFGSYDYQTGGANVSTPIGSLPTNHWTHISVTSDSNGLRCIFSDGVLVASGMSYAYGQALDLFLFGRDRLDGPDRFFAGSLDDIRIYNRALTAKEVAALYKSEAPVQFIAQPAIYPDGTLLAKAEGGEVSYQWFKNGIPISGGTSASLRLATGSLGSGTYTLRASNGQSSVTSGSLQYSPVTNPNFHDVVPVAGTNVAFSRYETTVGQWKAFAAETGWNKSDAWKTPGFPQTDSHPVVNVSLQDAKDYCNWLSLKAGKKFRLPEGFQGYSEYPTIPTKPADGNLGFVDDGFQYTAPVGSFAANQLGVFDVIGNVMEWNLEPYYAGSDAPFITVGGAWSASTSDAVTYGNKWDKNTRQNDIGFRVVEEM